MNCVGAFVRLSGHFFPPKPTDYYRVHRQKNINRNFFSQLISHPRQTNANKRVIVSMHFPTFILSQNIRTKCRKVNMLTVNMRSS